MQQSGRNGVCCLFIPKRSYFSLVLTTTFLTSEKNILRCTGCCRKTPNEVVEARLSSTETEAQVENLHPLPHPSSPPSVAGPALHLEVVPERAHHGGGWLLSGIICINVLILGCALVTSSAKSVRVTATHRQAFLIALLLLTMLWMLFYTVFTSRPGRSEPFKDNHAGPVWLKGENTFVPRGPVEVLMG